MFTLVAVPSATDLVAPAAPFGYPLLPSTCGMLSPMIRWRRDPFCNNIHHWIGVPGKVADLMCFEDQISIPSRWERESLEKHKNQFKGRLLFLMKKEKMGRAMVHCVCQGGIGSQPNLG